MRIDKMTPGELQSVLGYDKDRVRALAVKVQSGLLAKSEAVQLAGVSPARFDELAGIAPAKGAK
jgi:hypothetical protein